MSRNHGNPKDVCNCGDYRSSHKTSAHFPEGGACTFNRPHGLGHHGLPNCNFFQLSEKAKDDD